MKTTLTLAIAGILLFLTAVLSTIESTCFHCVARHSINIVTLISTPLSLGALGLAFIRLFRELPFIETNSYNAESLLQFIPYESQPPVYYPVIYPQSNDFGG